MSMIKWIVCPDTLFHLNTHTCAFENPRRHVHLVRGLESSRVSDLLTRLERQERALIPGRRGNRENIFCSSRSILCGSLYSKTLPRARYDRERKDTSDNPRQRLPR